MRIFLLTLLVVLLCPTVYAQQQNVLKVAPLRLLTKNVNLAYERALGDKHSIELNVNGYLRRSPQGVLQTVIDQYATDTDSVTLGDFGLSGYTLTTAYRYYVSGEAPRGFFLTPFVRFINYGTTWEMLYQGDGNKDFEVDGNLRFRGLGGGLGLGFQFISKGGFTIEWHGGLGVALAGLRHRGTITGNNVLPEDIADVEAKINEILAQVPFVNQQIDLDQAAVDVNFRVPGIVWPMVRSSLSLGYAF
ncbi:MAG: hypothetical protein OHK0039_14990 [Bacteroidia bacterium]